MENKTLEKTLDMAGNLSKIAANLSEVKKDKPQKAVPLTQTDDNSNKATTGTQSVIVAVDKGNKKEPKPVEQHIHEFPENRALTSEECELALKKAQMDYELKKANQQFIAETERKTWEHKLEQEKKEERRGKIRRIIGGILIACGVTGVGYSIYQDWKSSKTAPAAKALPAPEPVKTEGSVN